jgi:hypothetical protein
MNVLKAWDVGSNEEVVAAILDSGVKLVIRILKEGSGLIPKNCKRRDDDETLR